MTAMADAIRVLFMDAFFLRGGDRRDETLPATGSEVEIAVEAAGRLGWDRWTGDGGAFVGMTGFGASAPAADLDRHFGITAEAVADAARSAIRRAA